VHLFPDLHLYLGRKGQQQPGRQQQVLVTTPEGSLERFRWRLPPILRKLEDFNRTLGEENGRYLTSSEKDAVVTSKGIPPAPEPH
jgi:hypothetical protein